MGDTGDKAPDRGSGKAPRPPKRSVRPSDQQVESGDDDALDPFRKLDAARQEAEQEKQSPVIKYILVALVVVGLGAAGIFQQIRAEDAAYAVQLAEQVADARHQTQMTLASEQPDQLRLAIDVLEQLTGETAETATLRGKLAILELRIEDRTRTREERQQAELERRKQSEEAKAIREAEEEQALAAAEEMQAEAQEEACRRTADGIADKYARQLERAHTDHRHKVQALNGRIAVATDNDQIDALYRQMNVLHSQYADQQTRLLNGQRLEINNLWASGACSEFTRPRRRRRRR